MGRRLASLVTGAALVGGLLGCAQQDQGAQPPAQGAELPSADRSGGAAACEAPYVHAERTEVRPGESLRVTGTAFLDTCNDTGTFGEPMPEDVPLQQIEVLWRQGGDVAVLGSVDAGPDGSFELPVTVPVTAVSGGADLAATFASTMFDDEYVAEGDGVEVVDE
ncbi:hypothetical protein [Georgenia yuyongxinii]|uniref:Lipoprotein n=1 Tax=Georgenia yuyongxinii TaxID=2589797 RepID=A0A552WLX4_9MICO|nr:hypothetical protein [Georgenia yuyongxinii]TRW43778.1 hypothetical protein FJ693_16415 [Georgenia yuyongxinii]